MCASPRKRRRRPGGRRPPAVWLLVAAVLVAVGGGLALRRAHVARAPGPVATRPAPATHPPRSAGAPPAARAGAAGPLLALVIDDWGCCDTAAARGILAIEAPLTLAVIPGQPHSLRYASAAAPGWREVILHLPMEADGGLAGEPAAGADELRVGQTDGEVARRLDEALGGVPGATGVSSHRGSRATADPPLMEALMGALAARGLPFLDSLTTPNSLAAETAARRGVPCLVNDLFLDEGDAGEGTIRRRLARLVRMARRDGAAIGIGHPRPATAAALAAELPRLRAAGVRLVTLSELREASVASGFRAGGGAAAGGR